DEALPDDARREASLVLVRRVVLENCFGLGRRNTRLDRHVGHLAAGAGEACEGWLWAVGLDALDDGPAEAGHDARRSRPDLRLRLLDDGRFDHPQLSGAGALGGTGANRLGMSLDEGGHQALTRLAQAPLVLDAA